MEEREKMDIPKTQTNPNLGALRPLLILCGNRDHLEL